MRCSLCLFGLALSGAVSALASVDAGLLALAPSGTSVIGAVDVAHIRESEFGRYALAKSAEDPDPEIAKFAAKLGFDPLHDLQSIVFSVSAELQKTGEPTTWAILARGRFNPLKTRQLAVAEGNAQIVRYGGIDMIVSGKAPDPLSAVAFFDTSVAALADLNSMKRMIDQRKSPPVVDADFQSKINGVAANNDVWVVASTSCEGFLPKGNAVEAAARVLGSIRQWSFGMKFGPTFDVSFDAVTRSEQDAQSLTGMIRFMTAAGQAGGQSDPKAAIWAKALSGITLQTNGTGVHFAMSIVEKSLEQWMDTISAQGEMSTSK